MPHTAMWLIPIAPFIIGIATTWSLREAFEETVWFNAAYVLTLGVIYLADLLGFGFISTSPIGAGGGLAMIAGFGAQGVARYRWKKAQYEKAVAKAIEQRRLAAERKRQGVTTPPSAAESAVVGVFRIAGALERSRRQAVRRATDRSSTSEQ